MPLTQLNKFFGRKPILDLLNRRVRDLKEGYRQNIAILGERYIGKSIILEKFLQELDDPAVVDVYLDLENKDIHYLFHKFAGSLLYKFAANKNLPLHDELKFLVEVTQPHLPQTIKAIRKIQSLLTHGKEADAYREIITLPQVFVRESNQFCVLILDEFQGLEDLGVPHLFQDLGKEIMTQKKCLYVVASSYPATAKKILSEKLSLLFGNFEILDVDPFDPQSAQEFIQFHLGELKIGEQLRHFLVDFSGGHPLYLRLICSELVSLSAVHKQHEIFLPLLTKAVENALFNRWGVLSRHFEFILGGLSSGRGNLAVPYILVTLAEHKQRLKDLGETIALKQNVLNQKISRLVEGGVVVKNGSLYYLRDKLFRYWLKYVLRRRYKTIDLDPVKLNTQFHEEFAVALENFKLNAQKDLSSRVMELLACFDNESLQINGRRYKLPFFQEIVPQKIRKTSGEQIDLIKGIAEEGDWLIAFKRDSLEENDIQTIVGELKKLPERPQKCIVISLANLDESARIKALQERMWVWNEGELNTLLNLYDKPYIIK